MKTSTLFRPLFGVVVLSVVLGSAQAQGVIGTAVASGQLNNGTNLKAGNNQSPAIQVFLESSTTLSSNLAMDVVAPGDNASPIVARGTKITDFLLHYDFPGSSGGNNATGTIRFGSPILGLIIDKKKLDESDSILGVDGVTYAKGERSRESKDDWSISGSELTFSLTNWTKSGGSVDEVRVILANEASETISDGNSGLKILGLSVSLLGLVCGFSLRRR